jgi:hypothetical protein
LRWDFLEPKHLADSARSPSVLGAAGQLSCWLSADPPYHLHSVLHAEVDLHFTMADLASRITKPDAKVDDKAGATDDAKPALKTEDQSTNGGAKEDGLVDNQYDVEVKLSDLQNDEANPLYSAKTFKELGL